MLRTVRFSPGQVVITPGALAVLSDDVVRESLKRHLTGDWGDVDQHDARENERSLRAGFRLVSAYHQGDTKFWIITEADRSVTTILLPEEY